MTIRHWTWRCAPFVDEVNAEGVDIGIDMRQLVEPCFLFPSVVFVEPKLDQLLHVVGNHNYGHGRTFRGDCVCRTDGRISVTRARIQEFDRVFSRGKCQLCRHHQCHGATAVIGAEDRLPVEVVSEALLFAGSGTHINETAFGTDTTLDRLPRAPYDWLES